MILLFGIATAAAWLLASSLAPCGIVFRLFACIVSLWVALPYLGARTQLISLLGLALLFLMLKRWQVSEERLRWFIPPLFDWAMVAKNSLLDREFGRETTWTRAYEDRKVSICVRPSV